MSFSLSPVMISTSGNISPIKSSMLTVTKKDDTSTSVLYNDPKIFDEEVLYTFNKDGSASSISPAWGTKTSAPKGTFNFKEGTPLIEMVNSYNSYQQKNKLDLKV